MHRDLFLAVSAARRIRAEISRARGNEVCFLALVGEDGSISDARVVARGHRTAVLAASRDAEPGSILIHNHPTGGLTPSEADLQVAAELYAMGVGLAITDNDASELYVVVEPAPVRDYTELGEAEIDALLGPGGPISQVHAQYEDRPTQRDMSRAIARAYNPGGTLLAEAGTGTGKSIAYLIPAIRWAVLNKERTVVSTNTINLQEQLVGKDLPFLRKTLGENFRFALVKGRNNYVSIRRAQLAIQASNVLFEGPQEAELVAIGEWLKSTRDGSMQDLPFTPAPEVWDEIASEADVCLRTKCPNFEQCFYQRARRDAASADVLVVNHHLLFSDLAVRRAQGNYTAPAVLPPYRRVILDEAHNIEDAATSHLGATVSRRGVFRALGRLERRGKGLLRAVEDKLRSGNTDLLQQDALRIISAELRPVIERARGEAGELFNRLEQLTARAPDGVLRITDELIADDAWRSLIEPQHLNLVTQLEDIARRLQKLRDVIMVDTRWRDSLSEQLVELAGAANRIRGQCDAMRLCFTPESAASRHAHSHGDEYGRHAVRIAASPDRGATTAAPPAFSPIPMVRWLERRGARQTDHDPSKSNIAAVAAPIDLGQALREALFDRVETSILTSATLATRTGFDFVRGRLGLDGGGLKVTEAVHPSPFDFETQTLIAIPTDLPVPHGERDPRFDQATTRVVLDVAAATDGGVFVLFTSYRSLRAVAEQLRREGAETRWPLYVQGEMPRSKLIERFIGSGRALLLGVASFWEGVDVPGDPLRGLVIPRLPFKVPSEPLTAARLEALRADGRNDFYDYMLPHAALRLKQGFGRLIRSRSDRGVVVLMDRRVVEKNYGRYFLESLPPAPVLRGSWEDIMVDVRQFYGKRG